MPGIFVEETPVQGTSVEKIRQGLVCLREEGCGGYRTFTVQRGLPRYSWYGLRGVVCFILIAPVNVWVHDHFDPGGQDPRGLTIRGTDVCRFLRPEGHRVHTGTDRDTSCGSQCQFLSSTLSRTGDTYGNWRTHDRTQRTP